MADKFVAPSMDWSSPGDMHKRFKLFKQKCQLIFDGPFENVDEAKKVRHLLLWVGDKGLEIYNTATFSTEADKLKIIPVLNVLENYTKPQSNQILARYQLRCLKQGDMPVEEFVTKARLLIDDGGYDQRIKMDTLRDTLVFGVTSDKVRRDAIAIGNALTFQQVYDLAKVDESTRTQMKAITQGEEKSTVHEVHSKKKYRNLKVQNQDRMTSSFSKSKKPQLIQFKSKGCLRCGNNHSSTAVCPAKNVRCNYCNVIGHYQKVCMKKNMKKVHEIVNSEGYGGQDIHLGEHQLSDAPSEEEYETENSMPIQVFLGTLCCNSPVTRSLHSVHKYPNKIYATVKVNDTCNLRLKVDPGADTSVINTYDLQNLPFIVDIKDSQDILSNYGNGLIKNLGVCHLKLSFKDKGSVVRFNIVDTSPNSPSLLGCRSSQELGIITVNLEEDISVIESPEQHYEVNAFNCHMKQLTKSTVLKEYSDCFDKIGKFPGDKYHISVKENSVPVIHPPRTVGEHIRPLYRAELEEMKANDIITEVTEPTEWVNSIVCEIKKTTDGKRKVRICLDPTDLNKCIHREPYYTRTLDEIMPRLHGKKYFSVVDTKKGYWHVELDEESSYLCTFNTPFGRYRFKRLPFGVKVSQDIFQRKLDEVYKDIPNVTGIADDILVVGESQEEHDEAFIKMLDASRANNIGLNSDKLQFKQKCVEFYGHTFSEYGTQPAAKKIKAIQDIKPPSNLKELLTILGMLNYLNRYSVRLADLTAPLRELTKKGTHFSWEHHHQEALEKVKQELCSTITVSYYDPDPSTPTILQCDASQTGLGAWLRQIDSSGEEHIVAMCSRRLSETESRYSNIERECLAVMYGLEKFEYYLLGRQVDVETDHSPLEQIFKKKISEAPARLQRFLVRCSKFDVEVRYKPGKSIPVADALSRLCVPEIDSSEEKNLGIKSDIHFIAEVPKPLSMETIKAEIEKDPILVKLKEVVYNGWPEYRKQCSQDLWEYWTFRCEIVLEDGMILKGNRIVVPGSLRQQVLDAIHSGHQGESRCILLARESVFWPGITNDIKNMVKDCEHCNKHQSAQPKLPIMQPELPTRPWEKLGSDIFEFKGQKYLMIVDYYSRFPVIRLLSDISAATICNNFTSVFAEYGLPSEITTDFGSQYTSDKFKNICHQNGITLHLSSPYHHQTNSAAERTIGTYKCMLKKTLESNQSPYTALWMYRNTPLDSRTPSPYELLFGRKPRTMIPSTKSNMKSKHPENDSHLENNQHRQHKQAEFYNVKASKDREELENMQPVYVRNTLKGIWEPATVLSRPNPIQNPRTYLIEMQGKVYQRTREHLRPRQETCFSHKEDVSYRDSCIVPNCKLPTNASHQMSSLSPRKVRNVSVPVSSGSISVPVPSVDVPVKESNVTKTVGPPVTGNVYSPKSQTTRVGRITKVPDRYSSH